jgi:TolB-like protein/tetratricopeptide (TPR) repeat protein
MSGIIPRYNYDIFISYRQNDNKYDGWVTEFVANLSKELEATIKDKVTVYFDANPHDGLRETHSVDRSLEEKLRCLIFIPILSRTYCDPKSYAWNNEFLAFLNIAREDSIGLNVKLSSGNVASRVLPIRIHDLNPEDISLVESSIGVIRSIDFIYKSSGVNRPLRANEDHPQDNVNKIYYRDQINKVANAVDEIIRGLHIAQNKSEGGKSKDDQPVTKVHNEDKKRESGEDKRGKSKRWLIIALSTILCIIGVIAIYKVVSSGKQPPEVLKQDKSIAVLPFVNDSPDKENEYFCNGIMEEILNQLQKIGDLKVKSRTSSEKYRNPNKDIKVIGKELGVSLIMEGSVRKIGDDLRITAQLIDAKTGDHLWSETYDGKYTTEIFEFQSIIAKKVASSLNAVITPQEVKSITAQSTTDMVAHDLYMRGHEMVRNFRSTNDTSLLRLALNLFDQALKIDPQYTMALHGKGMTYNESGKYDSAMVYYKKLQELDPESGDAYLGIGGVFMYSNQPDSSLKYYQKALTYPTNEFEPWVYLGIGQVYFMRQNEVLKSLPYYQKAIELGGDTWSEINQNYSFPLFYLGYFSEALKYLHNALSLRSESFNVEVYAHILIVQGAYEEAFHFLDSIGSVTTLDQICDIMRSRTYIYLRDYDKADEFYKKAINSGYKPTEYDEIYLGCIYNETGRTKEALSILKQVIQTDEVALTRQSKYVMMEKITKFSLAAAYAIIGDNKKALGYLSELEKLGLFEYPVVLKTFPGFDNLRNYSEFKAIVKRIEDQRDATRAKVREMEQTGELHL